MIALEEDADGPTVDPEAPTELEHRCAFPVANDELLGLRGVELAGS